MDQSNQLHRPLDQARVGQAHKSLLGWYDAHARDLPWRRTRDPYAILVAEVMLQQTQVERVLPKYAEFLGAFPTLAHLARAPRSEGIRRWAPLGYNRRAVHLHRTAQHVVEHCDGVLPRDVAVLQTLPGIGRYTAAAIACFAFDAQVPILDTNVRRVLGRVFYDAWALPDGDSAAPSDRQGWQLATTALPPGQSYVWNQALMDLGATICTAARPACPQCPLGPVCAFRQQRLTTDNLGPLFAPPATEAPVTGGPGRRVAERSPAFVAHRAHRGRLRGTTPATSERFVGSRRWYRGRILTALRALTPEATISLGELGPQVREDFAADHVPWLAELVQALASDGLLRYEGPTPASDGDGLATVRVALPR